jgi:ankyrin repeat protein
MEQRRRVILANLESRIKTSAEREFYARNLIRKELVEKANNGDTEGIKLILTEVAAEAAASGGKPRASVEVRNDGGQSLLSIAAQNEYAELAEWLLTYYKEVDKDRWDLLDGEISTEAKIFKANPNSRDLKGWTCVCIAVFHDSRKVLKLLLENGGDPNIRSSYNKNAWDLAKVRGNSFMQFLPYAL